MSVNSATFLELFAGHATPLVVADQLARRQREEVARASGRRPAIFPPESSPLAPPYQIYPSTATLYPDEHAA